MHYSLLAQEHTHTVLILRSSFANQSERSDYEDLICLFTCFLVLLVLGPLRLRCNFPRVQTVSLRCVCRSLLLAAFPWQRNFLLAIGPGWNSKWKTLEATQQRFPTERICPVGVVVWMKLPFRINANRSWRSGHWWESPWRAWAFILPCHPIPPTRSTDNQSESAHCLEETFSAIIGMSIGGEEKSESTAIAGWLNRAIKHFQGSISDAFRSEWKKNKRGTA